MKVSRTIGNGRQTARILLMMLLVLVSSTGIARAQWAKVSGAPNASTCLLLTDGSVMCQAGEESHDWNRLTPDSNGHYETGTWTPLPSFPSIYGPLYYASAVLADGRVIVIGGEYNNGTPSCTGNPGCDVNLGYILDPNSGGPWTALTPPAWGSTV